MWGIRLSFAFQERQVYQSAASSLRAFIREISSIHFPWAVIYLFSHVVSMLLLSFIQDKLRGIIKL